MDEATLTDYVRESNAIEGIYDEAEIDRSMVAWEYLENLEAKLTHGIICRVQKVITLHQALQPHQRGYYRDLSQTNVTVGNYLPPHYAMVQGLMDNWLLDYEELGPWKAHARFESIHPFVDGNGRTGRMLMWWQELQRGEKPTLIKATERQTYYDRLKRESKVRTK
jgi:Fic family protein